MKKRPELQREKIIKVLEDEKRLVSEALVEKRRKFDADVGAVVECGSPGHCALGALLFAVGFSDSVLRHAPADPYEMWHYNTSAEMYGDDARHQVAKALETEYGVDESRAEDIIGCNDTMDAEAAHRRKVGPNDITPELRCQIVIEFVRDELE